MHAFLINGGTQESRQKKIKDMVTEFHIDLIDVVSIAPDGEHITIADVRNFQKRLLFAPMQSTHSIGIIENASLLTTEGQQALLKLLEEPPPRTYVLLETESAESLLPTIISRCQIVRLATRVSLTQIDIKTLLDKKPNDLFTEVDKHTADRIEAKKWAGELLEAGRMLLLSERTEKIAHLVRNLLQAQKELNVNCNPKLVLDRVFLF